MTYQEEQRAIEAAGGDYPYYLEQGGELDRKEWEAAGYPVRP